MKRLFPVILSILALVGSAKADGLVSAQQRPQRVVSLVPSVTEMLFAIGAGPRVVGVSSFDRRPEVGKLPKVGGLLNPDLEAILALRPDLVVVYTTQTDLRTQLERAGVPMFPYRHGGIPDITAALERLGAALGSEDRARAVAADIEARLTAVRTRLASVARPKVLVVFGREPGSLRNVYASGGVGFIHDMLVAAGGDNALADFTRESVQATTELILARAPEVIVEFKPDGFAEAQIAREREAWKTLASVPAVRSGRVRILIGDEYVVPGPRIADAAEKLARALHPGAF